MRQKCDTDLIGSTTRNEYMITYQAIQYPVER